MLNHYCITNKLPPIEKMVVPIVLFLQEGNVYHGSYWQQLPIVATMTMYYNLIAHTMGYCMLCLW